MVQTISSRIATALHDRIIMDKISGKIGKIFIRDFYHALNIWQI